MSEHQLSRDGRSRQYADRVRELRKKASRIATQEQLNARLLLIVKQEDRQAIFEIMEPYLPFPCATCPAGQAQDFVGN